MDFDLPMNGLRFDGGVALFQPVKAAALFATKSGADDFAKACGDPVAVVKLSDAQTVRAYLVNARRRGGAIVLFDPCSL